MLNASTLGFARCLSLPQARAGAEKEQPPNPVSRTLEVPPFPLTGSRCRPAALGIHVENIKCPKRKLISSKSHVANKRTVGVLSHLSIVRSCRSLVSDALSPHGRCMQKQSNIWRSTYRISVGLAEP